MNFARQPVVSPPKDLTPLEFFIMVDAYVFVKRGAFFPLESPELTELELLFLKEAYKVYFDMQLTTVQNPQFEEGMRQLDSMDKGGVTNF